MVYRNAADEAGVAMSLTALTSANTTARRTTTATW